MVGSSAHPFATNAKWWGSVLIKGKKSHQHQRRRTGMSAPHEQKLGGGGVVAVLAQHLRQDVDEGGSGEHG